MKLTPIDLQQKTFRKVRLGGVDAAEVDAFLELAAGELEELVRRLNEQDEELRRKDARIAEFREREHLLQETLTTAQKLAEELRGNARKEAEIIISDAELQAEKIVAAAQAKRLQLVVELQDLKRVKTSFLAQVGAVIEAHKGMLEGHKPTAEQPEAKIAPKVDDNVSFFAPPSKRDATK